jgi:hypothetical protein
MSKQNSNRIEGFKDQTLLDRLVNEHRGGWIRMFVGLAGVIAGLVYLGMAGPRILSRWTECNQAVEKGLTATDVCLEQEKVAHSRNHSTYKEPFNEEKERQSCGWALDEQGLTDKDVHAFCFAGRYGHSGWKAVKKAAVFGGLPFAGGLLFFLWGLWRRRRKPRFFMILRDSRERVVWVYVQHFRRRNAPDSRVVMLGLDTGQEIMIHLGRHDSHDEATALAGHISAITPWAQVGFDEQTKKKFQGDPASLKKG